MSTHKLIACLPTLPSSNENSERKLNPMSKKVFTYLSGSPFFPNLTPPDKQLK